MAGLVWREASRSIGSNGSGLNRSATEVNSKSGAGEGASPKCGRYPFVADSSAGKSAVIEELRQAIGKADTVIIATDCDREGQAIGENISTRRRSRAPRPIRS